MKFRNRELAVSSPVYEAAKALAEIVGMSGPDEYIDITLGQLFEKTAHLKELQARTRKDREATRQWYLELNSTTKLSDDQLI